MQCRYNTSNLASLGHQVCSLEVQKVFEHSIENFLYHTRLFRSIITNQIKGPIAFSNLEGISFHLIYSIMWLCSLSLFNQCRNSKIWSNSHLLGMKQIGPPLILYISNSNVEVPFGKNIFSLYSVNHDTRKEFEFRFVSCQFNHFTSNFHLIYIN